MIENPAEEHPHEAARDPVSQTAGQELAAFIFEIFALLQQSRADQI
jgi:hypothetical protein